MGDGILLDVRNDGAFGAVFRYRNFSIAAVEDIQKCVDTFGLSEEQHDVLSYDVATAYIHATSKIQEFTDPLIAQYDERCGARNLSSQESLSATDRVALNAATKRHTERNTRLSTLRTTLEEAGWDDKHPYIKAVMKGNVTFARALTSFIKVAGYPQDFCMLNLSRYVLFRIARGIQYASGDLPVTSKDFEIITWSISVMKGNKLKDELQRKLKAATVLEGYAGFTISDMRISREDIEAAEKNYSGYIRFSDDYALLSLDTNIDPNDLPALPPYRREIEEAVVAATAAGAGVGIENEDEIQQNAEQEPNRGNSREVRKRRTSASPPMATTGRTRATAKKATPKKATPKKATPKKAKTAADADTDTIANWKRLCKCDVWNNAIPQHIRDSIVSLENTATHGKSMTEIERVRQTATDVAISIGDYAVCHSHCFIFATHAGIYKGAVPQDQLLKITQRYGKQNNEYFASDEAAELIKCSHRDEHRYDSYGLAQVKPSPAAPLHNLHHELAMRLLEEIFPGMRKIWERDGDIVSNIFGWIFSDREVVTAIEYEVDIYDYHLRVKPGQSKKGWLRNANFTQIQQLIRMDLLFYMLHVLLHEDHPTRMISYPYEMKLAMTGMSTAFSHLDLSVHKVVADLDDPKGSAYAVRKYIQSAVSLTEEDKRNCTKIIPGMHKDEVFKEWAADQPNNPQAVNAGVTFTEEHAEKFDTKFRYDVCKAGEARISDPRNLHGTDGPATRRRVAVFAWLVEHNGKYLAHPGTGSVDELSRAHRDLLLGPELNSPSGYPNKTGIPLEAFPASMQLLSTSAISSALVGRVSYADPSVERELEILFGDDTAARVKLIEANRKTMLAVAKKNWRDLFAIEATRFGIDSFAANKDIFRKTDHIQRHTTATFPELMQMERQKTKKEKIDKQQPVDEGEEVVHDSADESDDSESMAAYVTVNNTDVLSEEDKGHPNNEYRSLGAK